MPMRPEPISESDSIGKGIVGAGAADQAVLDQAVLDLTCVAATVCDAPIAVTTLGADQAVGPHYGLELVEGRELSIAKHLGDGEFLEVLDVTKDRRFRDDPLVIGAPYARFMAEVAIRSDRGSGLGALCVFDVVPRKLSPEQLHQLRSLAAQVARELQREAHLRAITEQLELWHQLCSVNARFAALIERSTDAIAVLEADGDELLYASPGFTALTGIPDDLAIGKSFRELIHPEDRGLLEETLAHLRRIPSNGHGFDCRVMRTGGQWRDVEVVASNLVDDPDVRGIVLNMRDVTSRAASRSRLAHQAIHDALTDLPNRALLRQRLVRSLARAKSAGQPCAVISLDIDRFRSVNDTYGRAAGDLAITTVAERLKHLIRPGDTLARVGADSFVVVAENVGSIDQAFNLVREIRLGVAQPISFDGYEASLSCSVGVTISDGQTPEGLLQEADIALYRAKCGGRDRCEVYQLDEAERGVGVGEAYSLVGEALVGDSLAVYYQPIVDLATRKSVESEALARIRRSDGTFADASVFIDAAEDTGLIVELGRVVLGKACAHLARSSAEGQLQVSVNISARQLGSEDLIEHTAEALAVHSLDPKALCLELRENTLIEAGPSGRSTLLELDALGVGLALDGFGTGWSSLSYLSQFPIDRVKIDRSLVSRLDEGDRESGLVRAIIELSRALGMQSVAEGVETAAQDAILSGWGCDLAQGFFYGRPAPGGDR